MPENLSIRIRRCYRETSSHLLCLVPTSTFRIRWHFRIRWCFRLRWLFRISVFSGSVPLSRLSNLYDSAGLDKEEDQRVLLVWKDALGQSTLSRVIDLISLSSFSLFDSHTLSWWTAGYHWVPLKGLETRSLHSGKPLTSWPMWLCPGVQGGLSGPFWSVPRWDHSGGLVTIWLPFGY